MTAPERTRRTIDPAVRGILVLAVVVVLGLLLLAKAAPSSSTTIATRKHPGPTTPTTAPPTTEKPTTTTPTTLGPSRPASQVKVQVANGTGGKIAKAAGLKGAKLKAKGYDTLSPANATARPTSAVYFAPGYQADAVAVGAVLGIPPTSVLPVPTPAPVPNAAQANVIVMLGQDTPA